jgi:hypothetical protein
MRAAGRLDREQRRTGEVHLALAVARDAAAEPVVGEPRERVLAHDALGAQVLELGVAEAEVADELEEPAGARDDAEAAAGREAPGEALEHALAVVGARLQRCVEHRQLVPVGEEGGRLGHPPSLGRCSSGSRSASRTRRGDDGGPA